MKDWLFNITGECGYETAWDNEATSFESRIFLPLFFASAAAAVLCVSGATRADEADAQNLATPEPSEMRQHDHSQTDGMDQELSDPPSSPKKERMYHLDFARIVGVWCVVAEHSGGSTYSHHDVLFVLQWVLPYLFVVSGMCFAMSSTPLWFYIVRLSIVLVVGVGINWIADAATGRDWKHEFGDTIFQMFYVVFLIVFAVLGAPLRHALKWRQRRPDAPSSTPIKGIAAVYGIVCLIGFTLLAFDVPLVNMPAERGIESWNGRAKVIFDNSSVIMGMTGGCFFLVALACTVRASPWHSWILLAAIYIPRVVSPFAFAGVPHSADLFILGMAMARWRITGKAIIATFVSSYWPLVVTSLVLLLTPGVTGRCDLHPPQTAWLRFRFYFIELVLVVCFVVGAFRVSDPWGWTGWLNTWALFAYVTHVAWHRLLPTPYGAVVTYLTIVPCWLLHKAMAEGSLGMPANAGSSRPEGAAQIRSCSPTRCNSFA